MFIFILCSYTTVYLLIMLLRGHSGCSQTGAILNDTATHSCTLSAGPRPLLLRLPTALRPESRGKGVFTPDPVDNPSDAVALIHQQHVRIPEASYPLWDVVLLTFYFWV